MKSTLIRAVVRQSCLALVAVVITLPFVWALHRAVGVDAPGTASVVLLGASVLVAFAGGGLLGAALHEFGRTGQWKRNRAGGWIAALGGFLFGSLVCITAASFYGQIVLEDVARQGASLAWSRRDQLVDQTRSVATQAAKELAGRGAARLPVLLLLVWTLLGPTLGAALEYRLAARR